MTREEVLNEAMKAVTERNGREDTFPLISRLWSAYLDLDISPADVCRMMALLKIARSAMGVSEDDSAADCAGYMACCAEYTMVSRNKCEQYPAPMEEQQEAGK